MRVMLLILLAVLPGCGLETVGALTAVELASTTVFGRGVIDFGISAVTGRDCSLVRLDRGKTYCGPADVPPPEVYCTRTLAAVDCWAGAPPPGIRVGDTPGPSRAQALYRGAPWPKTINTLP